jgi:undecaprenyl pyrophosphate synthase
MKKLIVMAATAALLTSVSMSTFAAGKSLEDRCKAQAEKHKIGEDKMDAYVKECVEKHMKHMKHKHKKAEKKEAPKAEAPAAPATPAAPEAPAKPAM